MGRPTKPAALKKLTGNPGKRDIPQEIEPNKSIDLTKPKKMKGYAAEYWDKYASPLHRLGLLTELDIDSFALLCYTYQNVQNAIDSILKDGPAIEGANGGLVKNPNLQVYRESMEIIIKLGARFGMTPSDRAKLAVDAPREDPFDKFLSDGKRKKPTKEAAH